MFERAKLYIKVSSVLFLLFIIILVFYISLVRHKNIKEQKPTEINQVQAQTQDCDDSVLYPHNWSQVQNNPQHTGYTDEVLGTTIPTRTWVYRFQPDKIHSQIQPI